MVRSGVEVLQTCMSTRTTQPYHLFILTSHRRRNTNAHPHAHAHSPPSYPLRGAFQPHTHTGGVPWCTVRVTSATATWVYVHVRLGFCLLQNVSRHRGCDTYKSVPRNTNHTITLLRVLYDPLVRFVTHLYAFETPGRRGVHL